MPVKKPTTLRILESACRIFAEKGYRDTTILDISNDAKANVAAVNYHYGSKSKLYYAVWTYAAKSMEEESDQTLIDLAANPEQWLRQYISNRVHSIFSKGKGGYFARIVRREVADPTPLAFKLHDEFLLPGRKKLETVIKNLLGIGATKIHIKYCTANVMGLYVFLNIGRDTKNRFAASRGFSAKEAEEIAKQTSDFAMSGILGLKDRIQKEQCK